MQEMRVCFQLGPEKIKAEVGYYERLFAMLIISGLQSESIWPRVDSYIKAYLHGTTFSHATSLRQAYDTT